MLNTKELHDYITKLDNLLLNAEQFEEFVDCLIGKTMRSVTRKQLETAFAKALANWKGFFKT